MTTNTPSSTNKTKELLHRLMILEKFLELKSNECAYYRSKVHLMQINSEQRSSSEDLSQSGSQVDKYRRSSVPFTFQRKSALKKNFHVPQFSQSAMPLNRSKHLTAASSTRRHEKVKKTSAQNQNYYEEDISPAEKNPLDPSLISYIHKHLQHVVAKNKNIQPHHYLLEPSGKSALMIRLPRRFVKSLIKQHKKTTTPKLKVQMSSELLHKLLQSIDHTHHRAEKFTIQSQYGTIAARISHQNPYDIPQMKASRPIIRHTVKTRSDRSEKTLHRRKHKSSSTSNDENYSKRSSLTSVTPSIKTLSSSVD